MKSGNGTSPISGWWFPNLDEWSIDWFEGTSSRNHRSFIFSTKYDCFQDFFAPKKPIYWTGGFPLPGRPGDVIWVRLPGAPWCVSWSPWNHVPSFLESMAWYDSFSLMPSYHIVGYIPKTPVKWLGCHMMVTKHPVKLNIPCFNQ